MAEQMQIKQLEPVIESSDIWKDDKLNCKEFAGRLTSLLQGQNEPLTIALNGAWGSGKTFLLKRWRENLKKQGYTAIYFNAWEDDHIDDPLIAIIGQLWIELKDGTFNEVCAAVKQASKPLIGKIGLNFLKKLVEMIPGIDLTDVEKKDLETASEAAYDDYLELTDARNDLRRPLQELANKVYGEDKYPLVFIVDELDRCRPTFAVAVLERIKHLFNIEHIIFVFGIDRDQLGKSIQSVYGEIDIENYLHRFFDLELSVFSGKQEQFIDALWERFQIESFLSSKTKEENLIVKQDEGKSFRQMFKEISAYYRLSLREIEQCIKVFAMIQNIIPRGCGIWPDMLVLLLLIKMKFREMYSDFIEGKIPPNEISDKLFPQEPIMNYYAFYSAEISLYASFVCECPNMQEENPVLSLLKDANNGNIQNNKLASKRLKQLNKDGLQAFAKAVTARFSRWYDISSCYNSETLQKLHGLVDMITM